MPKQHLTVLKTNDDIAVCSDADALLGALKACASDILSNLGRMAAILRRLDELGVEVTIDHALIPYIRMIANGQLSASCFVACAADPLLLEKAVSLPLGLQEKIANDEPFDVLGADGGKREVKPSQMGRRELSQVFKQGKARDEDEQREWLQGSANKSKALKRRINGEGRKPHNDVDRELITRIQAGDSWAEAELFSKYERFLGSLSSKHARYGDIDDYKQVAAMALIKCARSFDAGNGTEFSTYLHRSVTGQLIDHYHRRTQLVRHPSSPEGKAMRAERLVLSLDRFENSAGNLPDDDSDNHEAAATETRNALDEALSNLEGRDKEILELRSQGLTLEEIGERLGVTRARIGQLESRAIASAKAGKITSRRRETFDAHVSWLIDFVQYAKLGDHEITKLTELSLAIDNLRVSEPI